jgi:hypothetical protein
VRELRFVGVVGTFAVGRLLPRLGYAALLPRGYGGDADKSKAQGHSVLTPLMPK